MLKNILVFAFQIKQEVWFLPVWAYNTIMSFYISLRTDLKKFPAFLMSCFIFCKKWVHDAILSV